MNPLIMASDATLHNLRVRFTEFLKKVNDAADDDIYEFDTLVSNLYKNREKQQFAITKLVNDFEHRLVVHEERAADDKAATEEMKRDNKNAKAREKTRELKLAKERNSEGESSRKAEARDMRSKLEEKILRFIKDTNMGLTSGTKTDFLHAAGSSCAHLVKLMGEDGWLIRDRYILMGFLMDEMKRYKEFLVSNAHHMAALHGMSEGSNEYDGKMITANKTTDDFMTLQKDIASTIAHTMIEPMVD